MGTVKEPEADARLLAELIADALLASAIVVGDQATWLAPALEWSANGAEPIDRTGDITLYDGSAGIALACSAVGVALGREDLVALAVRAAGHAVAHAGRAQGVGLYDGLAGVGLAALAVGQRANDAELTSSATAILDDVRERAIDRTDLISGLTGVALAFVRAFELTGHERWVQSARVAADKLVDRADRRPWGWAWPNDDTDPGLCGMAHGAAGAAWALAEVAEACGEPDLFDRAIAGARQFERSWFDPRTNSWPDLRPDSGAQAGEEPLRPALWCHGSVGIGVSRLAIDAHRPHPALQAEIAAALQSSCASAMDQLRAGSLSQGLTVCHGLAGTVDFLLDAHLHLGELTHLDTARWLVDKFVVVMGEEVEAWPGGVQGRPGPGLMNGLAGTMAVLTRLDAPDSVPSVVRLAMS